MWLINLISLKAFCLTNIVDFCISVGYFIFGASFLRDNIYCPFLIFYLYIIYNVYSLFYDVWWFFLINIRWVYQENKSENWNLLSPYFSWQIIFAIINFSLEIRDSPPPPNILNIFLNFFFFFFSFEFHIFLCFYFQKQLFSLIFNNYFSNFVYYFQNKICYFYFQNVLDLFNFSGKDS